MLYPDLRRLSLVCPTGMPGTNQAESGGSNDPLPRPPLAAAARAAAEEALGMPDVLRTVLFHVVNGEVEDACKAAARWCSLNKAHRDVCDDFVWTELTRIVFPTARAPNAGRLGRGDEPTEPKDWFFYLCTQHKKLRELNERLHELAKKGIIPSGYGTDWYNTRLENTTDDYVELVAERSRLVREQSQLLTIFLDGIHGDRYDLSLEVYKRLEQVHDAIEDQIAEHTRLMWSVFHKGPAEPFVLHSGELKLDYLRILRAIEQHEAYMHDLEPDPEAGPPTLNDVMDGIILEHRMRIIAREVKEDRERYPQSYRKAEYKEWLAEQERKWPREAALSKRIEEAHALISRAAKLKLSADAGTFKVNVTIVRILKARKAFHSIAGSPEIMNPLVEELERYVRLLEDAVGGGGA